MRTLAIALLLTLAAPVSAEPETAPALATIAGSQHYVVQSESIGQAFSIDVLATPSEEPLPVVYVLDGNLAFALTTATVQLMQIGGELPPMILVGIGYEVENPLEVMALRTRDLTPTPFQAFVDRASAEGSPLPEGIRPGGADAFLTFIDQELKPFIAARYNVDAEDQTLVGDSFGGLFALHVLFQGSASFDRYVVGSPSIWWENGKLFGDEKALADRVDDLPVQLFLSVGALEEGPEAGPFGMVSNLDRMTKALQSRNYPNLSLTHHVFEGETHLSVVPATISRGLRAVFAAPSPDSGDE